ncbi:50S ribosomal protein L23 [Candidatus Uhrbacteria bacterium]|nr:50S ribosomal protein L23 [Candidatus Uhrbacteria bacterium]
MAWNIFKRNQQRADATAQKPQEKEAVIPAAVSTKEKNTPLPGKKFSVRENALFIRPIVTEKSLALVAKHVYVFEVAPRATKIAIKKACYNLYGIMPVAVRLMNMAGKEVRFGQRSGRRKDWKKALITIPKDKIIDI